ncbi:hypothetical protein K490DRAFT_74478 [Saccharata proteae CBS 121410]|uniref:F-box domain-containing protein n=1 Tax=Saccharata proteae CBS 121410 TaxID=1314787 RepID=A0A9P4HQT7_9PEZI|nr:hypothetical protein K490DRAFT_74478 [Saccharata proteae CBS 121410]
MDASNPTPTEAELESFRRQWREEVQARSRPKAGASENPQAAQSGSSSKQQPSKRSAAPAVPNNPRDADDDNEDEDQVDDGAPQQRYDGAEETESGRRVAESKPANKSVPESALEHYEEAVKRETQGNLGDSVNLYRKAFRLDSAVQDHYKKKHFPPSAFPPPKPTNPNPSNASVTVPNTAHHSLQGLPPTLTELVADFSKLSIPGLDPPTDLSPPPPCPISSLPEELLADILIHVAVSDVATFARLSLVCKRLAYLVMTEERVWRRIVAGREYGFAAMHFRWACEVSGSPLLQPTTSTRQPHLPTTLHPPPTDPSHEDEEITARREDVALATAALHAQTLIPKPYPTHRALFRSRPRIRFNGCYISTVNYTRPGASSSNTLNWASPVLIVTYYRYLRFFRDGTVISLLTTAEPHDVVAHLSKENLHQAHGGSLLPQAVMKDALRGRWRISGAPPRKAVEELAGSAAVAVPGDVGTSTALADDENDHEDQEEAQEEEEEEEGTVHIETEGVTPKYVYKLALAIGSAGRGARNNKLAWKGYWSYNRLTDDWAEFGLKNDRAFYWSRVKSWGKGL